MGGRRIAATVAAIILAGATGQAASAHPAGKHEPGSLKAPLLHEIGWYRGKTQDMRAEMGKARFAVAFAERRTESVEYRTWVRDLWKGRYVKTKRAYVKWEKAMAARWNGLPSWWVDQAMQIHSCEGSWTDSGGPYYGGMQMDISFQIAHGREFYNRWGTANNWPVWAQLTAAYRGWLKRGWSPWPACAAHFGLL